MHTRLLFLTALLIGFPLLAEAQDREQRAGARAGMSGAIFGQVMEADTDDTLIGASVALWTAADSSLVTGTITQDAGRFELTGVRPGTYYVQVSFIGMVPETIDDVTIGRGSRRVDLGTVALAPDTAQLDEVEVSARRDDIEFGIDRTRYTLRDQVVTAGGSALDALETVPSVEVDVDGAVSLRGSQNVAIHINGRPTQMSGDMLTAFLQGLQSESIEAVEVMPNPSVRYDPSGMSGILNIVLKENIELGWSTFVSAGGDSRGSYNTSTGLTINYGRWRGTASYGLRSSDRNSEGSRYRLNRFQSPQTALNQLTTGNRESFSHNARTSLRYDLSDKNELSFSGRLSLRDGANYTLNANTFANGDDLLLRRYDRVTENSSDRFNMNYQLGFTRVLERNTHEFAAEVRWGMSRNDGQNLYREETLASADIVDAQELLEESSSRDRERSNASLRIDYERPLADWGRLETGYRGNMRTQDNSFFAAAFDPDREAFLPQENLNNRFTYDRQVHALYGILQGETGRVGAQVGVRLEQTFSTFDLETTGEAFDNRYFSFFPNAYLTYSPIDGHQLKASYGKRINRPGTRSLNPFDDLSDPLFRRVGNPFLLPEYTHNIELSYTRLGRLTSLSASPYVRYTTDVIRRNQEVRPDGVSVLTYGNLATQTSYGSEFVGTLRMGRTFNAFVNFNLYRVDTDGSNVDTDLTSGSYGWSTRASVTYRVVSPLSVQASYFYRAPMQIEQGRSSGRSMATLGARYTFLNDRANLSFSARDLFNTMNFSLWRDDDRFYQETTRSWNAQSFSLSLSYTFGQPQRDRRNRGDRGMGGDGMSEMDDFDG